MGYVSHRANEAELALVRGELVDLEWADSRRRLSRLAGGLGVGAEARTALAVVRVLSSSEVVEPPALEPRHLARLPVGLLLERALAEERYDGCARLVSLLRRSGAPSFDEFEAAALLEQGRIAAARSVDFARMPASRVGARLAEVLAADLSDTLVRDRRGVLLGRARRETGVWTFEAEPGIEEEMVPLAAVEGLEELLPARSVRLTLDRELSRLASRALGSYRGSIGVVDPRDGSILAAVSDPRTHRRDGSAALAQLREPASIAKLITVSAALRAGIDVDHELEDVVCRGSLRFEDGLLYCSAINGKLRGLERAMAVSCNVAFAHLGRMVGRRALVDEYRRYGFGADGAFFGSVLEAGATGRRLGDLAIGLEAAAITPTHAALQAAAIANGGWMHRPRLHRSTSSYLGFAEHRLAGGAAWKVLEEPWVAVLTHAMEAVASPGGTAARIAPPSFPVAMKTGTASEPGSGFHVNYIGFGPLPDPGFAFAVRVTHQPTSRRVRNAAYAVTRRFLRGLEDASRESPKAPPRSSVGGSLAG